MKSLKNFAAEIQNKKPIFDYYPPKNRYIGIVSIPHSGLNIPQEFERFLTKIKIDRKQDVDFFVHELIDIAKLQEAGIAVIKANIIRTAIDLNRSEDLAVLNWKKNSKGKIVVTNEPTTEEALALARSYYAPYFEMLKALINELSSKMKKPSIIDLHSMPSKATEYHLKINPNQKVDRPDFCVSDQTGTTCLKDFIDEICISLKSSYPVVTQNDPYFGGYITQHIQKYFPETNNIQIEIKRSLYMDENEFKLIEDAKELKMILTDVIIKNFQKFFNA